MNAYARTESSTWRAPSDAIPWRTRLAVADHAMVTGLLVMGSLLDRREASEADWDALSTALHRLRAVREVR